ncbi:MAG: hypothetical protein ABSB28_11410 [Candidatus Bathyarchaeia archaeon]
MAELPLELGIVASFIAAILTATFAHLWTLRRENDSKKMKIIGWLEWLKMFLETTDQFRYKEQKINKLPWWADHAMQDIGESLYLVTENTRRNLLGLINECWLEEPVVEYLEGHNGKILDVLYDKSKVQTMKRNIDILIKQIIDP